MKSLYASKLCICFCPVAQRYRQRRVRKVSLLATIRKCRKSTRAYRVPQGSISHSTKRRKGDYASCSLLSYATANRHLRSSGERNGEQRRTKVRLGRTMMQGLELQRLVKRHISGRADVEQWGNQAHSISGYRVMLVWRHQIVSQSVEKSRFF